ncbi:hypothetical protein [Neobacillus soli]|uniref:hypothetical protein n=1 Tax=Neobacillus soli TaxID=220688 RepID=UPI000B181A43|nr:hypothetical protein [Neobacillus soli]
MKKKYKNELPQIRAHISNELLKQLKIYAAENEKTVQSIIEEYITKLITENNGRGN